MNALLYLPRTDTRQENSGYTLLFYTIESTGDCWEMAFEHDHCRCPSTSLSGERGFVLSKNVITQFPEQPCFFWHHNVTLHGPCPFPRSTVHAGSECCAEWFYWLVELVPSPPVPQYLRGEGGTNCSVLLCEHKAIMHSLQHYFLQDFSILILSSLSLSNSIRLKCECV